MIADIVKSLKLIKYGLNIKSQLTAFCLFFVLGVMLTIVSNGENEGSVIALGGVYLVMSGVYFGQMYITVSISKMIQSSPYKKRLQVVIPNVVSLFTSIITFSIFVGIKTYQLKTNGVFSNEEAISSQIVSVILTAFMAAILLLFVGAVYKMYIAGMLIMAGAVLPIMLIMMKPQRLTAFMGNYSYGLAIGIGYAIIVVGFLLSLLVSRLVYRRDMSEIAYKNAMKRIK